MAIENFLKFKMREKMRRVCWEQMVVRNSVGRSVTSRASSKNSQVAKTN